MCEHFIRQIELAILGSSTFSAIMTLIGALSVWYPRLVACVFVGHARSFHRPAVHESIHGALVRAQGDVFWCEGRVGASACDGSVRWWWRRASRRRPRARIHTLARRMREYLPSTFDGLSVPLALGVYRAGSREPLLLTEGDLPSAVAASCAVPKLFSPVAIEGTRYADGGAVDRTMTTAWQAWRPGAQALE